MAEEKTNMPSGMGGLVRYFDDYKSKISFKPSVVVIAIVIVIVFEFLLHKGFFFGA
jgi:preprotein translocase subunit Sec61beta